MMKCVLKDLIEYSKDGEWGKDQAFDESEEMLCIRGTDFEAVRFGNTDKVPNRFIAQRHADRKRLRPWDMLIEAAGGTKNQPTGRTVLLKPSAFQRASLPLTCASFSRLIRFRTDLCDPAFIFWYLQGLYHSDIMRAYHTQHTGVARFQWTTFAENEPLQIPDFPTQRKIAGILSAYDDLIENNLRRIKILEEMAQSLYREWFVHFRFPGHESAKFVDSELGKIPEGWEVKKLGELYKTSSGGTPSRKNPEYFEEGTIDWVKTGELKDCFILGSEEKITEEALSNSSAKLFPADTVLIALYGATIGQLGILSHNAATNQACCAILEVEQPFGRAFAYLTLLLRRADIIGLRLGAAQQNISQTVLRDFEVICPPTHLLERFNHRAEPTFYLLLNLQRRNQNLRRTRDLLLPKLCNYSAVVTRVQAPRRGGEESAGVRRLCR